MRKLSAKFILYTLLSITFILLILNILSYINLYTNNLDDSNWFFRKFNFDEEKNAPNIFSGLLHIIAAFLLFRNGMIKLRTPKMNQLWFSLSVLFLFVGLDEILRIHEMLNSYLRTIYDTSGIFHYIWVIPYGIGVIIIGLLSIKPLLKLPKKTFRLFMLAAFVFLFGAVGIEMFTGWYIDNQGLIGKPLLREQELFVFYTFEELFEMLGVIIFIHALVQFSNTYRVNEKSISHNIKN